MQHALGPVLDHNQFQVNTTRVYRKLAVLNEWKETKSQGSELPSHSIKVPREQSELNQALQILGK